VRDLEYGDHVLDTDGEHWVDDVRWTESNAPTVVDASAVAVAGHGAPHGPRDASETAEDAAYDQSPYPAPASYVTLTDVPWGRRKA
jgi:hypothetical protein